MIPLSQQQRKQWIQNQESGSCCASFLLHKLSVEEDEQHKNEESIELHLSSHEVYERHQDDDEELHQDTWSFVKTRGNQFIMDGKPFYFNGFNTYWLMVFGTDESTKGKVSHLFQEASTVGLSVCRTWAFNDGQWRALQRSPSVYDEQVFKGLDFVVSEARKYRIRLILSMVNNWEDYGGKAQYVKWGKEAGLNLCSNDDFFSHETIKSYYKAHVNTLLNRVNSITNIAYKDDPTILAWELMNEPRCESDPSGDKLHSWIEEMAEYVKSIDPKHLLEIGLEGFYGPSTPQRVQLNPDATCQQAGTDFIRNHQAPGVDFASVHMYPDSWLPSSITDAQISFTKTWMQSHIEDAEHNLGMPVVFSEFGVSAKDPGYNTTCRDRVVTAVYSMILNSTSRGGSGAGCLLWQLLPEGTEYMDDGYAVVLSNSPSTSSIISLQSTRLNTFNSGCSWNCRWGCNRKQSLQTVLHRDEL